MSDVLTPRFDHIVYPTDGSPSAVRAQWHATHLATHYGATLHVVHVDDRSAAWNDELRITDEDLRDQLAGLSAPLDLAPPDHSAADLSATDRSATDRSASDSAAVDRTASAVNGHGETASGASDAKGLPRIRAVDSDAVDSDGLGSNGAATDGTASDGASPLRTIRRIVTASAPARGILRYAHAVNAGLIVMGTSGRRGLDRIRQGSVTEAVVNGAECPVLTVSADSTERTADALERILVPLTFEPHDALQVMRARMIAHAYDAGIDLLHVVADTTLPTGDRIDLPGDSPHLQRQAHRRLEQVAALLKSEDLDVLTHVREGQPAQEVIRFARHYEMDLLILTTRGRTTLGRRLLGSVAEKIVRQAPCPVLSLRLSGRRAAELLQVIEQQKEIEPQTGAPRETDAPGPP